ncbi:salt-induced outer membrane protein [Idiomarina xiamenensis 10-D-4]|uniref:Salt-induced outer membrane protein n=2 Tax=Idiomarina xiamenensis TaxID=1207041 RepID=K2JVR1_9GAMM|nr:salt-induced outer membrane protein [Idiomarina xiamenensis 10-D-4]
MAAPSALMFDDNDGMADAAKKEWQISAELGVLYTSGNTETESFKGKLNGAREYVSWRHKGVLDYYKAKQTDQETGEDETTADKLFASAQTNYKFAPDSVSSLFVFGSYENDKFSGYDYQATIVTGYGARYRYSENLYADYEIGPGYSWRKPIVDDVVQETETSAILRLAGNMVWDITENSRFNALLASEIGEDNTKTRAEVSVSANINASLAMKVSVSGTHNSYVSDETIEKLDTETAVTLVYTF